MPHIPTLIYDLALILVTAGITTIVFKWLKQPVVLGYIVAGFLVGSDISFLPHVSNINNINVWAEIGIIILLFSLGLEFSFKKLMNVGGSAFITATIIVLGMMGLGFGAGQLLGFTLLDSLFLGGMLSMSSTTIIIKAFSDLGLRKQKFTSLVFGVLIVEDLFAILTMVVLTSIAVKKQLEGGELMIAVLKLAFFLILWFVIGTFVLPLLLKKVRRFLNPETLLIVAMGLCLGMVVIADKVGFSAALGAFVMGSILAGTVQAEKIEKEIRPVKDLFGAVFFISVGMLVNPTILYTYAWPVIVLSLVVICGQIFFSTTGMLVAGQPLQIAVKSGMSLAQIGEFAFIIATLGMSLKVIDSVLYPIVVAVSVITTFTTPYFIKAADPLYHWLEKTLPERLRLAIHNYSEDAQSVQPVNPWKSVIGSFFMKMFVYSIFLGGIISIALTVGLPFMEQHFDRLGTHLVAVFTMIVISPILWSMSMKRIKNKVAVQLWYDSHINQVPLLLMILLRILLALAFVVFFLSYLYSVKLGAVVGFAFFFLAMLTFSNKLQKRFVRLENLFLENLNERELRKTGKNNNLVHNIHLAHMDVEGGCPFVGQRLMDADLNKNYGVNVVSIKRGGQRFNIPQREMRIFPGDVISIIGADEQIAKFLPIVEQPLDDDEGNSERFVLEKGLLDSHSPFCGKTIAESGIRNISECMVVAIERADGTQVELHGNIVFNEGDWVWLVGEPKQIAKVFQQ